MKVTYLNHMGTDLSVVNAARVSFGKRSEMIEDSAGWRMDDKDIQLIRYLANHDHWTPFAHCQVSLHLKVPFFVAAQVKKHQVGFVVNEVSRRYVDAEPEFYMPETWRKRAENVKQGSSDEALSDILVNHGDGFETYLDLHDDIPQFFIDANETYLDLIKGGVCPEQARMVLPMSTYTEFWMTGSLAGWARVYKQRTDPHTQRETQEVAKQIGEIIDPLFPVSWKALTCFTNSEKTTSEV